jgi:pyruvate/2-oxoglutarate dehydrogenase complex dihydrolipoamide acyltransferase (E2) component
VRHASERATQDRFNNFKVKLLSGGLSFAICLHMSIQVLMPALSPTMEEGTIAKWLVRAGDRIKPGDVIAEIETDKATMEVEAVDEGVIEKILVPEGAQNVKVNEPIAVVIGDEDEAPAPLAKPVSAEQAAPSRQACSARQGGCGASRSAGATGRL